MTTKRIIAREWIIFVVSLALGFAITLAGFYVRETRYLYRFNVLDNLASSIKDLPQYSQWYQYQIAENVARVLSSTDTARTNKFARALAILPQYNGWTETSLIHEVANLRRNILIPINPANDFLSCLFGYYWLPTWLTIFSIYVLVQFVRSILWSIKTLKSKEKP